MFSNMKPTFGTTTPGSTFGLGASTSTTANPWVNSNNTQMFGKPASTGFGQPNTSFGQPSTSSNSIFPFFPQSNSSGFGSANTNQSTFGSTIFGQQQQQAPATNTLFGSNNFGQQKSAGFGFGAQNQQQPNLFGQPAQPQNTLFQPAASSNLFGSTNAFGPGTGTTGTTVKFAPVNGTDTMQKNNVAISINTKHHCITCMKEYEGKSLEELRFEDYQANRKGPQSQFGSTPFGNTPIFGQTTENKPAFGQTTGFGQIGTTTGFGQQNQTFGMANQQSQPNNIFGKTPGFGTTGTTSAGFGAFNTPSSVTNAFGANQTKPFGAATPLFGATQTQQQPAPFANNLFGQNNQNTTSSFFNKPAQTTGFNTGGFGFNQPATTTANNLFQQSKPTFGLGQPASTGAFGQTSTFGQANQPNAFGASSFGKPLTFGQNTNSFQIGGLNNLFSNTQQKPGSLLGTSGVGLFGGNNFGTSSSSFGVTQLNMQSQTQGISLDMIQESKNLNYPANNQFGHTPFLTSLIPTDKSLSPTLCTTNPAEIKKMLENSKKVDGLEQANKNGVKLRTPKTQRDNLFEETNDEEISKLYKMSCKRLTVKKEQDEQNRSIFEVKSICSDLTAEKSDDTLLSPRQSISNISLDQAATPVLRTNENTPATKFADKDFPKQNLGDLINKEYSALNKEQSISGSPKTSLKSSSGNSASKLLFEKSVKAYQNAINSHEKSSDNVDQSSGPDDPLKKNSSGNAREITRQLLQNQQNISIIEIEDDEDIRLAKATSPCGIILTRSEYYTLPPIEELDKMVTEDGRCMVKGFTVGRRKYGNVYFPDEVNVKNLNLDEIVHFRFKEINMYPDGSKKPPVGEGLNRRAQVTLDRVYPRVKETKEIIEDVEQILSAKFPEHLMEISMKHGMKFVDYRPETGSWVFMVEHFSKYGLTESDEEDCEMSVTDLQAENKKNLAKTKILSLNGNRQLAKKLLNGLNSGEEDEYSLHSAYLQKSADGIEMTYIDPEGAYASREIPMEEAFDRESGLINDTVNPLFYSKHISSVDRISSLSHYINGTDSVTVIKSPPHGKEFVDTASEYTDDDIGDILQKSMELDLGEAYKPIEEPPSDNELYYHDSQAQIMKAAFFSPIHEDATSTVTTVDDFNDKNIHSPRSSPDHGDFDVDDSDHVIQLSNRKVEKRCFSDFSLIGYNFGLTAIGQVDTESTQIEDLFIQTEVVEAELSQTDCTENFQEMVVQCLEAVLSCSDVTPSRNENRLPTLTIKKDKSFLKECFEIFKQTNFQCPNEFIYKDVWSLCNALWGFKENEDTFVKERVSSWLKKTLNHHINIEQNTSGIDIEEGLEIIFQNLCCFNVAEAAKVAMDIDLPVLSMLISQLNSANKSKELIKTQLADWCTSSYGDHISPAMIKIYILMCGEPFYRDVNIYKGLDWKRAFGLHLWYFTTGGSPIQAAVEGYTRGFENEGLAAKPNPLHDNSKDPVSYDILFHLLNLFKNRAYSLSKALAPSTYTDVVADYTLPWLLLLFFDSIDVGLNDVGEETLIHTRFSRQLERCGLWQYAVLPLLFLKDKIQKEARVIECLHRNIPMEFSSESEEYENALMHVNVPYELIREVRRKKITIPRYPIMLYQKKWDPTVHDDLVIDS